MDIAQLLALFSKIGVGMFALLAITNPFGTLPMFMSMSEDLPKPTRDRLFRTVALTAAVIVFVFAIVGNPIMTYFFRIDLASLRVAGGLLLMAIGLKNLLFPQESHPHDAPQDDVSESEQVHKRIIPMAFPILVGPGTLSTVIVLQYESGIPVTMVSILLAFTVIFILFCQANIIERFVGKLVLFVSSRIMQVFIMAVGAQMMMAGLLETFPMLKG